MKKTVFFDLGNVLLFFDLKKMERQITQMCDVDEKIVSSIIQKYFEPYEKGHIDTKSLHTQFCLLTGKELDYPSLRQAMSDIFQPNLEVISLLSSLKENGVRLFILSNTCEAHFDFAYQHYPFLRLFDGYVLSFKIGARKPEKKIFEEALNLAECRNQECFYTDDIPEFISAAKSLNIDAEQYTTTQQLKEHLRQRKLL